MNPFQELKGPHANTSARDFIEIGMDYFWSFGRNCSTAVWTKSS